MASKNRVFDCVDDLVSNFLYYDRREDDEIEIGAIEQMIHNGEITVEEIVRRFEKKLREEI